MNVLNVNTFEGFKVLLEIKMWISANIYSFENFLGLLTYERRESEVSNIFQKVSFRKGQYKSHNTAENLFKGL